MKKIYIAGVTGSIGTQALDVLNSINFKNKFELVGCSVNSSMEKLKEIIEIFKPKYCSVLSENYNLDLYKDCRIFYGKNSFRYSLEKSNPDIVLIATSGFAGLNHSLISLEYTNRICLANKETIVCGGKYFLNEIERKNIELIPVDSEHSAVYQLRFNESNFDKIILTASGGSIRDFSYTDLKNIKVENILKHPTWDMGKRITVDSSTMVNKGLEVIEAYYLFNTKNIEVLINRDSHVHSMMQFNDGVIKIHYGFPDMKIPIAYSFSCPERIYNDKKLELIKKNISFETVDNNKYPALKLAFDILGKESLQIAYNSSDEIAVDYFLNKKIHFLDIYKIIYETINRIDRMNLKVNNIEDIYNIDKVARNISERFIKEELK